jgi:hypothetical protein
VQQKILRALGSLYVSRIIMKKKYDYEQIAALYQSGKSLNEIAAITGARGENVRYALKRMGIPRRPRGSGSGEANHQFKGGVYQRKNGYQVARGSRTKPLEHRRIAEIALGKPLDAGMVVHHIDCNPANNRSDNLLICSHAYHMELHARMRAHPYWSQFSNPLKSHE